MSNFNCDNSPMYPGGVAGPIPPFWGFSAFTPTIPKLYWDVKSQEQRILNLFDLLNKLVCYCDQMGLQIDINADDIKALQDELQELENGGLWDLYEQEIAKWAAEHMPGLVADAMRSVYFGLTSDGYFCAYIPDGWSDIVFDTGAVYGRSDYGRLILKMQVDGKGVIDNTYSYSTAQATEFDKYISDLELTTKRTDLAFKTLFTHINQVLPAADGSGA